MAESDSNDEVRLVLRAQTDDRDAIEALFIGLHDELRRYVYRLVGHESAEDVLQEVFVKIWRNLRWLERAELFRPWAYRIASRTCYRFLKRERRWTEHLDSEPEVENLPSGISTLPSELIGGLEHFVEGLSPASRAVVLLHYGQDVPIEDAAAILQISVGTAKSRLAYGLACLRKLARKECLKMPQEPSAALRDALDQMERSRKRSLLITRIAIYPSVLFLIMSVLIMLFHSNKWLGATYGVISLFGMIGAGVLDIERSLNTNTQRILKAIDVSLRGEPRA